jgi:hypothetical protein
MAFVHDHQEIIGKEVEEAEGPLPRSPLIEIAGIILDAGAIA